MPTTPLNVGEGPVTRQLEAYNQRNVDAFVLAFHPNVRVYNYPDVLTLEGREALREQFTTYFDTYPALHCELMSRVRIGTRVIDEERILRVEGQPTVRAVAIYDVEDDLITEVRSLRA